MKRPLVRPGNTLVEMVIVVTVLSFVLSAAALSLHLLYRSESQLREELRTTRNLDRLSRRWREDVHAAVSAQQVDSSGEGPSATAGIDVVLPGGDTVEYRAEAGAVRRTVRRDDAVVHRDTFLLGDERGATWAESTAGEVRMLSLVVTRRLPSDQEGPAPIKFDAALRASPPLIKGEVKL